MRRTRQTKRNIKYKVSVPRTRGVGSYSSIVANKVTSKEKNALWIYNSAREHDGLPPLKRMPKGTKYIKQTK